MDSRKLIKFGKSSYVISVPKDWVKENKLNKGDLIFLENESNELRMYPTEREYKKELKKVVIDIDNKSISRIKTEIVGAYLTNAYIIEIRGKKLDEQTKEIMKKVRNLSGLEIMEHSSKKIVAQDLLDESDVSIRNIIRRVDMMVRSMIDDAILSLRKDYYDSIFHRDLDVNRLVFLSYRVMRYALQEPNVAKKLKMTPIEILMNWMVILHMEKLADQTKRIARLGRNLKIKEKDLKEVEDILKTIKQEYFDTMKAFYTKNHDLAYKITVENSKIIKRCNKFSDKHKDYVLASIVEFLRVACSATKHIARSIVGGGSW